MAFKIADAITHGSAPMIKVVYVVLFACLLSLAQETRAAPCAGFDDVDSSDPFCANIAWMKNRGITLGCSANLYCPEAAVTRAQMAAFMARLDAGRLNWVSGNGTSLGIAGFIDSGRIDNVLHVWRSPWGATLVRFTRLPDDAPGAWRAVGSGLVYASADCTGQAYIGGGAGLVALSLFAAHAPGALALYRRQDIPISIPLPVTFDAQSNATASRVTTLLASLGSCESYAIRSSDLFHPVDFVVDLSSVIVNPITLH